MMSAPVDRTMSAPKRISARPLPHLSCSWRGVVFNAIVEAPAVKPHQLAMRGGRTPDIAHLAIALIERRLKDAFLAIKYEVHGVKKDA
jgi:hypothetical protein